MLPSRVWTGWPVWGQNLWESNGVYCWGCAPEGKRSHVSKWTFKEGWTEERRGELRLSKQPAALMVLDRGTFSLSTQQRKQTQYRGGVNPRRKWASFAWAPALRPGSFTDYRSCDVSFAIWSPLTPSLSSQKWTLRGGSRNNFIHICVRHEHIGFCLLNLWLTFLRVIKSCAYEWTEQSKDTRPHPAAIP